LDLLHHHLHERLVALTSRGFVPLHDFLHSIFWIFIILLITLWLFLFFIINLIVKLIKLPLESAGRYPVTLFESNLAWPQSFFLLGGLRVRETREIIAEIRSEINEDSAWNVLP
jgi:uncharacterized metal-binding protein